jgi:hypothetical protein
MKLILTHYVCSKCSNEFDAPELPSGSYGDFLLRSAVGEIAYLNGIEDPTYEEVSRLLARDPSAAILGPFERAGALQKVYGKVACDAGPSGAPFHIGANPKCPRCHCQEMASWMEKEPPEFVDLDVPIVTHEQWNLLSEHEKIERVRLATDK